MKIDNHNNTKHKTELQVQKRQEKEQFVFKGVLKPKPNQRVWELNLETMEVCEAEFVQLSDTVHYWEVLDGSYLEKEIFIQSNHDYVIKLNIENAVKYYSKKYNCEIHIKPGYETNILPENLKNINKIGNN